MRILVIEDDSKISSFLKKGFKEVGYAADVAADGEEGLLLARQGVFDAIVVDLMLPKLDGLGVIERIRGLQAGGDDYMVKPFSFSELLVRIQTLLRRAQRAPQPTVLQVADLRLNLTDRTAERGGMPIELQPREFSLLEYLMRNPGRVITKTAILEHVYDYSFDPQTNVVDVLVCRLRNRIDKPFEKKLIHTVRGVGYVLKEDG